MLASFTPATFDGISFPVDPVLMVSQISTAIGIILVVVLGFVVGIRLIKYGGSLSKWGYGNERYLGSDQWERDEYRKTLKRMAGRR